MPQRQEGFAVYSAKQMIVIRRDLHMRKGKIAAQAGHACVEAVLMGLAREERHGEPTYTCLAFEPRYPDEVDPITGALPLF